MQHLNVQTSVAIGGFALALFTNIGGVLIWVLVFYSNSEKKKYAAERDFNHLKNNQKDISNGIASIAGDFDKRFDSVDHQLLEIKTYLNIHRRKE